MAQPIAFLLVASRAAKDLACGWNQTARYRVLQLTGVNHTEQDTEGAQSDDQ